MVDGVYCCNQVWVLEGLIVCDIVNYWFKVEQLFDYFYEDYQGSMDVMVFFIFFWENEFGLYNLNGNVFEIIRDGDFCVGGDWYLFGFEVCNQSICLFIGLDIFIGFCLVMVFVEKQE